MFPVGLFFRNQMGFRMVGSQIGMIDLISPQNDSGFPSLFGASSFFDELLLDYTPSM